MDSYAHVYITFCHLQVFASDHRADNSRGHNQMSEKREKKIIFEKHVKVKSNLKTHARLHIHIHTHHPL